MKTLLLIFSLAIIHAGCSSLGWEKLDQFQQFLSTKFIDIDNFINTTLTVVQEATEPSSDMLNEIDKWFMPWEYLYQQRNNCSTDSLRKDNFKKLYLVNLGRLKEPVMNRIEYLRKLKVEISSSFRLIVSTAHFKNQTCSISSDDCYEKIVSWIEDNVSALRCKVVRNCQSHSNDQGKSVAKRSLTSCPKNEFKCLNGQCVDADAVCGGRWTCDDGSDETPHCEKHCFEGYHCRNLKCIDKLLVCDNKDDCGDNSDESGCPAKPKYTSHNCNLELGKFLCKNDNCIALGVTCNGVDDCGDGSDEGGLCGSGCPGRCEELSGVCLATPDGPVCLNKCPFGYLPTPSGCHPPPELLPTTVEELVEEMSGAVARYISSLYRLKQETFSRLFKASADYSRCYGDQELNKITKITSSNETYDLQND